MPRENPSRRSSRCAHRSSRSSSVRCAQPPPGPCATGRTRTSALPLVWQMMFDARAVAAIGPPRWCGRRPRSCSGCPWRHSISRALRNSSGPRSLPLTARLNAGEPGVAGDRVLLYRRRVAAARNAPAVVTHRGRNAHDSRCSSKRRRPGSPRARPTSSRLGRRDPRRRATLDTGSAQPHLAPDGAFGLTGTDAHRLQSQRAAGSRPTCSDTHRGDPVRDAPTIALSHSASPRSRDRSRVSR